MLAVPVPPQPMLRLRAVLECIDAQTLLDLLDTPSQAAELVEVLVWAPGFLVNEIAGILHDDLTNFHNILLVPQQPGKLVIVDWDYLALRDEIGEDVFEERVDATLYRKPGRSYREMSTARKIPVRWVWQIKNASCTILGCP